MRIAFFDDHFFEVYGAQENLLLAASLAKSNGHDVTIVTIQEGPLAQEARARGLAVRVIPAPSSLCRFEKQILLDNAFGKIKTAMALVRYSSALHRYVRESCFDVVIVASVRSALLIVRSRIARSPEVVLYAQNSTPFGLLAAGALPGLSAVALIASEALQTFPAWSLRILRPRMIALESGRDLQRFRPPTEKTRSDVLALVTVCAITERKGLHVVLSAMSKAEELGTRCSLVVVGGTSGPESEEYLERLRTQAEAVHLSVTWVGWSGDVEAFLQDADVFVLGSYHEGLPGVLIEAAATALPCVVSDAGGSARVVSHGKTGYVVPIDDAAQMAAALRDLDDPERRRQFGLAARHRAEEFSLEAFGRRIDSLLTEVART